MCTAAAECAVQNSNLSQDLHISLEAKRAIDSGSAITNASAPNKKGTSWLHYLLQRVFIINWCPSVAPAVKKCRNETGITRLNVESEAQRPASSE